MAGRLVLRKTIAASPHEVFSFWTDAESMKSWMCPCGVVEARARLDVRIGGSFEIVMKGPEGDLVHSGTYRVVDPPRKLVFTWTSAGTSDLPTLVTVEFLAQGRGTEVVLTHEDLPDDAAVASHGNGWASILDLLAARASAPGSGPPIY